MLLFVHFDLNLPYFVALSIRDTLTVPRDSNTALIPRKEDPLRADPALEDMAPPPQVLTEVP